MAYPLQKAEIINGIGSTLALAVTNINSNLVRTELGPEVIGFNVASEYDNVATVNNLFNINLGIQYTVPQIGSATTPWAVIGSSGTTSYAAPITSVQTAIDAETLAQQAAGLPGVKIWATATGESGVTANRVFSVVLVYELFLTPLYS